MESVSIDKVLMAPLIFRMALLTRMNSRHALNKRFNMANETTYLAFILLPSNKANKENPKKVHMKANRGRAKTAAWKSDSRRNMEMAEKITNSILLSTKAIFLVVTRRSDHDDKSNRETTMLF